jgi:hypothetical protein
MPHTELEKCAQRATLTNLVDKLIHANITKQYDSKRTGSLHFLCKAKEII